MCSSLFDLWSIQAKVQLVNHTTTRPNTTIMMAKTSQNSCTPLIVLADYQSASFFICLSVFWYTSSQKERQHFDNITYSMWKWNIIISETNFKMDQEGQIKTTPFGKTTSWLVCYLGEKKTTMLHKWWQTLLVLNGRHKMGEMWERDKLKELSAGKKKLCMHFVNSLLS